QSLDRLPMYPEPAVVGPNFSSAASPGPAVLARDLLLRYRPCIRVGRVVPAEGQAALIEPLRFRGITRLSEPLRGQAQDYRIGLVRLAEIRDPLRLLAAVERDVPGEVRKERRLL